MAKGHKGPGMGRRNIPINKEEFEKLCGLYCTCLDIAGWFHCSVDTIERWVKRTYDGRTFAEVFKEYSARTTASLRRKQIDVALSGQVAMLIWLGKQHLGQSDKIEQKVEQKTVEYKIGFADEEK